MTTTTTEAIVDRILGAQPAPTATAPPDDPVTVCKKRQHELAGKLEAIDLEVKRLDFLRQDTLQELWAEMRTLTDFMSKQQQEQQGKKARPL